MNRVYGLLLTTALVTSSFGCGPIVTIGGDSTSSSPSPSGGGEQHLKGANNIAEINGDTVEVSLGNYTETCGADNFTVCGPQATWQVRFDIPVAQLTPGIVLKLADANGFVSGTDAADPSNFCGGGGGTFWDGTVEVLAVTDTKATLRLAGTSKLFFEASTADGDYDVLLCGQKPPPPHLMTSAVATPNLTTPGNLMIYATNLPNTCADPNLSSLGCSVEVDSVVIDLSPAMQAVGTYPLKNIATATSWAPDAQAECSGGGGSYWGGTIQITSINASQVAFTLSGTDSLFVAKGNADGTFTAPRCK